MLCLKRTRSWIHANRSNADSTVALLFGLLANYRLGPVGEGIVRIRTISQPGRRRHNE